MSIVSRVFDKYQWIKGDWHSLSWNPEVNDYSEGEGYRSNQTAENYTTCLGACAMGIIHIDTGRKTYGIADMYDTRQRAKEANNTAGMQLKDAEYCELFVCYLQAAIEVISNTTWHRYALLQRRSGNPAFCAVDYHDNYVLEILPEEMMPKSHGIVEWNDKHTTKEEDVREFFEVLSIHREYIDARNLMMKPDFQLVQYAKKYIESLSDEWLNKDIGGMETSHYLRLKGANVI